MKEIDELEKKAEKLERLRIDKKKELDDIKDELIKIAEKINASGCAYLVVDI